MWALSTTETALTAHLVMKDRPTDNELLSRACNGLHDEFEIVHTTLQLEHGEPKDPCGLSSPSIV